MSEKARRLRALMAEDRPIVVIGAHNGLSAKIAEEAGFDAIWASGFEISASYAVPDANILSMAENLEAAKAMNDAVSVPVIADCDNGYGNAINVIRTVREYERAGIAGICIEDNVFPKRCSFYAGVKRELVSAAEHAGKIRAAVDARGSEAFAIIARTEALIAGWGMGEALSRARAYAEAGADLCLIHSKSDSADEVLAFASQWDFATPLVCVPTIYKRATVSELHAGGYKMIIFANQGLRASVKAMRETFVTLRREGSAASVDERIAPLEDVYALVGERQLKADEKKYLAAGDQKITAIILAAGFDEKLLPLVADRPKAMLDIRGKSILERQIETLNGCGIRDVVVVRGYRGESIHVPNVRYYDNPGYAEGGELTSLFQASLELKGRVIVLYGDILFDRSVLEKLLKAPGDVTIVGDRAWRDSAPADGARPDLVVEESAPASHRRYLPDGEPRRILSIGRKVDPEAATSEFIGLLMLTDRGCQLVREAYRDALERTPARPWHEADTVRAASVTDLVQEIIDRGHEVSAVDIYKGWMEIDTFEDYQRAWATAESRSA